MFPLRILVVDDNSNFLKSSCNWLALQPSFQVVGKAESGAVAFEQIERLDPTLVLLDMKMPDVNGLEITRRLKTRWRNLCVIILSLDDQAEYRSAAELAGADGFLNKAELAEKIYPLIQQLFPLHSSTCSKSARLQTPSQSHATPNLVI